MRAVELRVLDAAKACCERWGIAKVDDRRHRRRAGCRGRRSTACSPAARTCCSRRCACASWRTSSPSSRAQVVDADSLDDLLVRTVVAATQRAARRRAPRPDARRRARRSARRTSPSTACRGSSASPTSCSCRRWPPTCRAPSALTLIDVLARLTISLLPRPQRRRRPRRRRRRRGASSPRSCAVFGQPRRTRPVSNPAKEHPMTVTTATTRDHRSRRDQRHRGDPVDHQHRRRRGLHIVKDNADAIFTWDYSLARPQLRKLYEKAKVGQWNAIDRPAVGHRGRPRAVVLERPDRRSGRARPGPLQRHGRREVGRQGVDSTFGIDQRRWTLSQFLHGEQGALLCTAKITETVPWYDAKLYAVTQVVDEARHVEVFARYLDEKLRRRLPGQRPPADAARRHHQRQPLGHDLPRHAGDGRGPRARRLRLPAPADRASRCSSSCCAT